MTKECEITGGALDAIGKFTVDLKSCGNPDHGQAPYRSVSSGYTKRARTLRQASDISLRYIRDNMLGGGNWNGGLVLNADGTKVARVSYNGRIWAMC